MADITFGTFVPEEKVNPYTETVKALAEASDKDENASVTLSVDVADAQKEQFKFQRAANAIGKTARLRHKDESAVKPGKPDEDGDPTFVGNVKMVFTLTNIHKARRKGKTKTTEAVEG